MEDGFELVGDGDVAPLGGVLVALRGGGRGVTEAGHQLAGRGPGLGGEGPRGVAEVMEMEAVETGGLPGPVPLGVKRRTAQAHRERPGEDQRVGAVCAVPAEVGFESGADRRWEVNGAHAGVGLGGGLEAFTVAQLDGLALDAHGAGHQVEVASAQGDQLAQAQSAEAGEEDQRPVALVDGVRERQDDPGVDEGPLGGPFDARAPESARVGGDALVFDRGVEDHSQQPIRLGRLAGPGGFGDLGVPAAHVLGADAVELTTGEGRGEMTVVDRPVELFGPRRQRAPIGAATGGHPVLGVVAESPLAAGRVENDPGVGG